MKWPLSVTLIRHDVSAYNLLKGKRKADADYERFEKLYDKKSLTPEELAERVTLARLMHQRYNLQSSDSGTSLADCQSPNAAIVGRKLVDLIQPPDVVFVSPYKRTRHTYQGLVRGWPGLAKVRTYEEERLREQEHGIAILYNDWRVFNTLHPEQRALYERDGVYWYRYPQGENVPDVRERVRSWMATITRDWAGKHVLVVTHHLCILAVRANFERWGEKEFERADKDDKPLNCGVTIYDGKPDLGRDGRLILRDYNLKLY